MNTFIRIFAAAGILSACVSCRDTFEFGEPTKPIGDTSSEEGTTVLWKNRDVIGSRAYPNFRIPSLLQTSDRLFAFCEARPGADSDNGDIDIVYRYSSDNGLSWSESEILFDDIDHTVGNPTGVYTKEGRIILFFNWQRSPDATTAATFKSDLGITFEESEKHYRRVFYSYSDDNGKTFSKPQDMTSTLKKDEWTFYACGPCHAIQLNSGEYAGRIIIPCDHKEIISGKTTFWSHVIWSDDNGNTWTLGPQRIEYGNECCAAELSDGKVFLDIRNSNSDDYQCRAYSVSSDGGLSWGEYIYDTSRPEPTPKSKNTRGCQGTIVNYNTDGKPTSRLVAMNPAHSTTRKNLTMWFSTNDGNSWDNHIVICEGRSGYSDMVVLPTGDIGILYENGVYAYKERISFEIVSKAMFDSFLK